MIKLEELQALVDVIGAKMYAGTFFVPEVKVGDYVLLHAGQAMAIVDEEYAKESLEEWRNVLNERPGHFF